MDQQTLVKPPDAEQELYRRRQALAAAISAHDLDALRGFVHPSYEATGTMGITWKYQDIMDAARTSFNPARDFQESVEIESVAWDGETALLTTTRHDNFTLFWFVKRREDTRQVETWRQFDGKWMIVGERLLGQHASLSWNRPG